MNDLYSFFYWGSDGGISKKSTVRAVVFWKYKRLFNFKKLYETHFPKTAE